MIRSFKNRRTERLYDGESVGGFKGLNMEIAVSRLDLINRIKSLDEIPPLRSFSLNQLKGDRAGQYVISINGPWRLVFDWRDGSAYNVEVVDYHKG